MRRWPARSPRLGRSVIVAVLIGAGMVAIGAPLHPAIGADLPPSWDATAGSQVVARAGHTLTVLDGPACRQTAPPSSCGRVLAVGGGAAESSTEIYEPLTEQWAPAPALGQGRSSHTATLLDGPRCRQPSPPGFCGRVLVAGGVDATGQPLTRAEVFDPYANAGAGEWTPVPTNNDMAQARAYHSATLLDGPACRRESPTPPGYCGKVLIVGSPSTSVTDLGPVELFDPAADGGLGAFTAAAPMGAARSKHTATLLDGPECRVGSPPAHCGKVLVAGGEPLATSAGGEQLYDPGSGGGGAWSSTGRMGTPRYGHTATLLDGPTCRGSTAELAPYCGTVLVAGGIGLDGQPVDSAEAFDPDQAGGPGTWTPVAPMARGRASHSATLLDGSLCHSEAPPSYCGQVLVAGGIPADGLLDPPPPLSSPATSSTGAELFRPAVGTGGTWTSTPAMGTQRAAHATVQLDGPSCVGAGSAPSWCRKVLVSAGHYATQSTLFLRSSELFDPAPRPADLAITIGDSPDPLRVGDELTHTLTVTNAGPDPAVSVVATDQLPAGFQYVRSSSAGCRGRDNGAQCALGTMAPGGSAQVTLVFVPTAAGTFSAVASVRSSRTADENTDNNEDTEATTVVARPAISPPAGPLFGGTEVVITGAGLESATGVKFGDVRSSFVKFESDTRIVASSPAHTAGTVPISIEGASDPLTSSGLTFTYYDHGWRDAGSLSDIPFFHTATRLRDGRVLVVGGYSTVDAGRTPPVAIFDPMADGGRGQWKESDPRPARVRHTATLLDAPECSGPAGPAFCGKVLVTGGVGTNGGGANSVLRSSELFDPRLADGAGGWTEAAPMSDERYDAGAAPLGGGRVLVVGGDGGGGAGSAEIFDAGSGRWFKAAQPSTARSHPIVVALGPGKVLVAGGSNGERRAEVFTLDPNGVLADGAGSWSSAGSMGNSHFEGAATILDGPDCDGAVAPSHCGRVLVVGGYEDPAVTASAEVFDPREPDPAKAWAPVGSMGSRRESLSASLLPDGTVLAVGGRRLGGNGEAEYLASTEVFDPTTGAWTPWAPLAGARSSHRVAAVGDSALVVVGGQTSDFLWVASTEIYEAGSEIVQPPPAVRRVEPGSGLVAGGDSVTISGEGLYDPGASVTFGGTVGNVIFASDRRLEVVTPAAAAPGMVPVTVERGGLRSPDIGKSSAFTYLETEGWVAAGPLDPRYLHTAVLLDPTFCRGASPPQGYPCGEVLVAGGTTNYQLNAQNALKSAQTYDPASDTWSAGGDLVTARYDYTATLLDGPACSTSDRPGYCGKVLVAGGRDLNGLATRSAELYDPIARTWSETAGPMGADRFSHTAVLLAGPACATSTPSSCGKVLIAGGSPVETSRPPLGGVEMYDPLTGTFSSASPMDACANSSSSCTKRVNHTATLLHDGRVLVAGGLGPESPGPDPTVDGCASSAPCGSDDVLRTTQVYDPASGSWAPAPSMDVERFAHSATRLDGPACAGASAPAYCGHILIAGGIGGGATDTVSVEIFDPATGDWAPAPGLNRPRSAHTATLLASGSVLVAGGGQAYPGVGASAQDSAEVYHPAVTQWLLTTDMSTARGAHTATLLDGPACRAADPPNYCGSVLAAGGQGAGMIAKPNAHPPVHGLAELFVPAPTINRISPDRGPSAGGRSVVISGSGFTRGSIVRFGEATLPPSAYTIDSSARITATAPANPKGPVKVVVVGAGGTSGLLPRDDSASFTYVGEPGAIISLTASPASSSAVRLDFAAPDDGTGTGPATAYVVKQSTSEITTDAEFDEATALCGGVCDSQFSPPPTRVGQAMTLGVGGLRRATTYHYAIKAVGADGSLGPLSNPASATTSGTKPSAEPHSDTGSGDTGTGGGAGTNTGTVGDSTACGAVNGEPGQVAYPSGYSLVGLPRGTAVPTKAPMYSWFDLGAGGAYTASAGTDGVESGRGYWAWFRCPVAVDVPATTEVPSFGLGAYRASMVGNPTGTGTAAVTGHDFAATWDQTLNDGAGGYHLSGYRQAQPLAVGQGAWVFSYATTTIAFAMA